MGREEKETQVWVVKRKVGEKGNMKIRTNFCFVISSEMLL